MNLGRSLLRAVYVVYKKQALRFSYSYLNIGRTVPQVIELQKFQVQKVIYPEPVLMQRWRL